MRPTLVLALFLATLPTTALRAQQARPFAGHWIGALTLPGQELGFDVDLVQGATGWTGDISIPAQGAKDLPLTGIAIAGDSITFAIAGVPGNPTHRGTISADGETIAGVMTQGGQSFPFIMRTGAAAAAAAAQEPRSDFDLLRTRYTKREVMVAMRDGVKLFTSIYLPQDTTRLHPIIFTRTPYSVAPYGPDRFSAFLGNQLRAFAREGYIIVRQDVRGRYLSEGQFVNVRPYLTTKRSPQDVDETTDTYDTIDWLLKNVPGNNGRVGISGTSYGGFYSSMGAIDAHPAVKAVSPQAPVSAWMQGDDFFHNGALLLPHAFDFFTWFGKPRPVPKSTPDVPLDHQTPDGYEYFLRLGALSNYNSQVLHDSVAFWNEMARHSTWDVFWQARDVLPHLTGLKPAMLWVGGWFDTENLWGALHAYAAAEHQSPGAVNRLVMGPWSHGQWGGNRGDSLGAIAWGQATSVFFTDSIEVPFFDYYLMDGKPQPRTFEAAVFETGTNQWRFLDVWPPVTRATALYLREGETLSFEAPAARPPAYDEYLSDPKEPVPYTDKITHWYDPAFMVEDQRFASRRPDVLTYQTPPLDSALTVAGPIPVEFSVSTSGTDCDWIVKVIDVFPDSASPPGQAFSFSSGPGIKLGGYQMLVRGDVLRGKFRNSLSTPEPFVPGAVTSIHFVLNDVFHTFRPGHRIMIQVQSTWFPMIDRNPGTFLDIFQAKDSDFHQTTQRVYRSAGNASRILMPVKQP
jgi:putative CocE/NonD family hydrolase